MFLLAAFLPQLLLAQFDTNVLQFLYVNQLYNGAPTNAPQTSLSEPAGIAFFGGAVGDITNFPAPNDGQVYLTQSAIGQPAGASFAFLLSGLLVQSPSNGLVAVGTTNIALNAQAWQLGSNEFVTNVSFYATGTNFGTNVLIASLNNSLPGTNSYSAVWTNDTPSVYAVTAVATDNLGNTTTSAVVTVTVIPGILVNGQFTNTDRFTFLATNTVIVSLTNPVVGGFIRYSTDGSDPLNPNSLGVFNPSQSVSFQVNSSVIVRAGTTDSAFNPLAEADPVNITIVPLYTLNASTAGGGSFTVSPPNGPYASNTMVTLNATASNLWTSLGWTGDASSSESTLVVTMNSTKTVQAVFGTSLTVLDNGVDLYGGSVQLSPSQSLYPYGSSVLLTAVPDNGDYFSQWYYGASFGGTTNPLTLVVTNGQTNVLAGFNGLTAGNFSLTVEVAGNGTATASPSAYYYASNATVQITATAASGQTFVGWSGGATGSANPLSVVMRSNAIIVATFSQNQPPTLAVTNPPDGSAITLPATISLGVSITNVGGAITNVTYFANNSQIGVATNSPFTFLWTNAVVSNYSLTAVAYASTGLSGASYPVSIAVEPPLLQFEFATNAYTVHESSGSVTLTVVNYAGLLGSVNYQTANLSAVGGNGISGDYTSSQGNVNFSAAQPSATFSIPIIDNYIYGSPLAFEVQLINPSVGALGNPATATVTIMRDDANATSNALLHKVFPVTAPSPDTYGQLTVYTPPPEAGGQWRFPWESGWRNSGDTAANLTAGDYPVQFRDIPGYLYMPLSADPMVTNATATIVTNLYYPTYTLNYNGPGSLTVNINPNTLPGTGWQLFGETIWHPAGYTTNLLPDTYYVAFEPVSGYATPASQAVTVPSGGSAMISGSYATAPPVPNGVDLPGSLPTVKITDYADYPYGYCGQLQSDVSIGYGSGAAVTANVVLTAAHLVFDDASLAYASNVWWTFQEQANVGFNPEPQAARGWFVLSGYAAQRSNDITFGNYQPDQSSPQSRDLDVAALYFLTYAARTGVGGYLSSDAVPNSLLTGSSNKTLVGYPVDGSMFGQVLTPGAMYATPMDNQSFYQITTNDQTYAANWLFSYPGNSGGPLCVQYANGNYYPAAVYLGTLFNNGTASASVVRAIDSNVVNLITLAGDLGDFGTNSSGGGVVTIIPNRNTSASNPAYLAWQIKPAAAVQAGAGWKLTSQSDAYYSTNALSLQEITSTNAFTVQFRQIPGWIAPTNVSVPVTNGLVVTNIALYTVTNPAMTINPALGLGLAGTANTTYQIQSNNSIVGGTWTPIKTNTLNSAGTAVITNNPGPGYYRALWLTNSP
jgi:hypothetical protein